MVLCIIALPLFALLGIFSVKYRQLTKDSLQCLFRTATLRKCDSGLDDRIKAHVTGTVLKYSPKTAKVIYKHYAIFSWIILALFVWSLIQSGVGVYNYALYGNCNGPDSDGFCLLDPTGEHTGVSGSSFDKPLFIIPPEVEDNDPLIGDPTAPITIIQFGCFTCPYTQKAQPIVEEVLEKYEGQVNLQYKVFPIPSHKFSFEAALASECAHEQGQFSEYYKKLLNAELLNPDLMRDMAELQGLNLDEYDACMEEERYKEEIEADQQMAIDAGVEGTPTFFINGRKVVGPKPFKTFKKIINDELDR